MSFTQKLYLWTLALLLAALGCAAAAVYIRSLSANMQAEKRRAETEQYAIVSGLSNAGNDAAAELLRGFSEAYASTGARVALIRSDDYAKRTVEIIDDGGERAIRVTSPMPGEYPGLALQYSRDLRAVAEAQRALLADITRVNAILTAIFCCLLYISLNRLTQPLRRLMLAMRALEAGKRARLETVSGRDEIALLSNQFQSMSQAVRSREAAIKEESGRRQRFIDDLSHELKTPATSIIGYASLLLDARLTREQRERALEFLIHESDRMQKLASKLMILTSLRSGGLEIADIPTDEFVSDVEIAVRGILSEKSLALNAFARPGVIRGDRTLLVSLAVNLIQNAERASPERGEITLKVEEKSITVEDNGRGMTKEQLSRARDPFYRADKARSRAQGGVGLGLSICQKIAEAHGAKLDISSEVGAGTRVKVEFATSLQTVGDLASKKAVSLGQGKKPYKEDTDMKKRNPIIAAVLTAAITVTLAGGSILLMPKLLAAVEKRIVPTVAAEQTPQADELIRLPDKSLADPRFTILNFSRPFKQAETERMSKLWDDMMYIYDPATDGDDASAWVAAKFKAEGVETIGDASQDGEMYYALGGDSVTLVLPDRELTDNDARRITLFQADVIRQRELACDMWYNEWDGSFVGERQRYTRNEEERKEELQLAYKNDGLRPQAPINKVPDADGFWFEDTGDGNGVIHFTQTFELTNEQLLQIIDLQERSAEASEERSNAVFARKSEDEWISVAKSALAKFGYDPPEKDGYSWSVYPTKSNKNEPVQICALYSKIGDRGGYAYCKAYFDPQDENRLVTLSFPESEEYSEQGLSLKSPENITKKKLKKVLTDEKWKNAAQEFIKLAAGDVNLTFRKANKLFNGGWVKDWFYVEVIATDNGGARHTVWINPDNMKICHYERGE